MDDEATRAHKRGVLVHMPPFSRELDFFKAQRH